MSSIAAASRSRPSWKASSTARIVSWSMNSSVTRLMPAPMIAATASPAAGSDGKNASIVDRGAGAIRSRSVASVMIPSVPWEPTNRWVRA